MKINDSLVMMKVLPQDLPMPILAYAFYPFNPSLEDEMKRLFANFTVGPVTFSRPNPDDVMEEFRHNGRDYEYCPELETGVIPQPNPRRKKNKKPLPTECAFCKNNGEKPTFYRGHLLKDLDGRVSCPILRAYTCPICGACGDVAHTIKYCPANKNPEAIATVNALKALRNSIGKKRAKDVEGRVSCPILRSYVCQTGGEIAHSVKNCPANKNCETIVAAVNGARKFNGQRALKAGLE